MESLIAGVIENLLSNQGDDVIALIADSHLDLPGDEAPPCTRSVQSFEEAGVLTSNKGVVLTLDDGSEFQITVVRSKLPRS